MTQEFGQKVSNANANSEGATPLRVALLLLPKDAPLPDTLANQPVRKLHVDQIEPKLTEAELTENKLAQTLEQAVSWVATGDLVCLHGAQQTLLLMPALKAAQHKLHPHAHLAALQYGQSQGSALQGALAQAKRQPDSVQCRAHIDDMNKGFDALCRLIADIAQRTIRRSESRRHYWFTEPYQGRVATLTLENTQPQQGKAQTHLAMVLTQGTGRLKARSLLSASQLFFLLPGSSEAALNQGLWALAAALDKLALSQTEPLAREMAIIELMQQNLDAFATSGPTRFVICLQAISIEALGQEITAMSQALAKVCKEKGEYRTPSGSYFSAAPLGQAKLAFVYPGVGTIYPDMLHELHSYFPALFSRLQQQGDLKAMLQADMIYQEDKADTQQMPLSKMAIAGVGASYLLTKLLVDEFAVQPHFALGYSMGEAAMWASLDVWQDPHSLIDKTLSEPLFTEEISGPLKAVRRHWQLSDKDPLEWNSFLVRCQGDDIQPLLERYPRVYLAITQGDTCVIAGCQASCQALLQELGKRGIAANRVTAMHTPPALSLQSQVQAFYHQAIMAEAAEHPVKFISAASLIDGQDGAVNEIQALSAEAIATSIAKTFCHHLDFESLIQSATHQGAALFVEVGADRQNCTLIDKILKASETPHVSVPVNARGANEVITLLKALGTLISHRVPVSLTVLQLGLKRELAKLQQRSAQGEPPLANTLFQEEV
ncbi:PfaB family protein [Shewanella loihica]|uniref:Omega-3 polyunsaturated fatty acid synthase PfaB n=1 Tax=Shewanella loihica (strain ATCC BAA-1088 / PV-4) TaxID=323850 RepID=A3QGD4_SHELP|nr:PfaB family protein [Shewanella loihica]ABO24532.1 omega-3 polyunsaturated fatty acid synthase PfaB [Shewanella loihica PV-4]